MGRILRRRQSSLEDSENRDIDVSKATKKSKTGHSASENLGKQIVNNVKRMALRDKTNALKEVQEPEVSPEKRFPVRKVKNPITVEITKNNSNETKRGVKGDPSQRVKRRGLLEEKETSNAEDVSNNSENVKLVKSDKLPGRPESKLSPGTEVAVLVKKSKRIAARKSLSDEKEEKKWVEQKVITAANSNQTKGNRKRKQPAEGESPEARIAEPTEPKRTAAPKNVAQPIPSVDLSDKDEKCGKSNTSRDSQTTSDDEATSESKSDSERKVVKEKTARNPKRRCQAKENESPVADHESPSGAKKSKRVAARKALVDATIVGGACEVVKANQPNSVCQKDETRNESKDKEMMLKNSSPCVSPIMKTPLSRRSGKPQAVGDVSSPQPLDIEPQPGCSREDVCFKKPKTPSGPKQLSAKTLSPLFSIFKKPDTPRRLSTDNKIFVSGLKESSSAVKHQRPVYDNPSTPLKRRSPLSREKTEELYEFEIDENEPQPKKKHRRIMKIQRKRAAPRKKPKAFVADPEAELRVLRNFDLSPSVLTVQKTVVTNERRVPPPPEDLETSTAVETRPPEDVVSSTMVQTPRVASSERVAEYSFTPNVVNFDPGPMSSPCGDFGSSTPMYGHEHSLELVRNGLSNKCYSPVISKDSPIPVLLGEYYNDPKRRDNDSDARSNVTVMSGHSYGGDLDVSASTPIKYRHDSTTIVQESKPIDLNLSNCFGFDEPEVVEKPLMSPIKGAAYVPPPVAPPTRAAPFMKKKLPLQCGHPQPAVEVNVNEVIKQLRFEVGNDSTADRSADLSVYDDSEITCNRGRSPIKRFLQPVEKKANVTAETSHDSSSENTPVPAKVPRLSYERPAKLRKQKVVDHFYKDDSESEDSDHADLYFEQEDNDQIKGEKKATLCKKNKRSPVKKDVPKKRERGMTKKEEEELENWAKLFNSQCEQVDSFGLCVE